MAAAISNEFQILFETADVKIGSNVTLSCHLSPKISAVAMEIGWFRGTDCVCVYKNREVTVGRGYEGRVSLSTELERGDVSLTLKNFRESDLGDYLCQVSNEDRTVEITIKVGTVPYSTGASGRTFHKTQMKKMERTWSEEERNKMKESALISELNEKSKHLEYTKRLLTERDKKIKDLEDLYEERDKLMQEKEMIVLESKQTLQMKDMEIEKKDKLLKETNDKLLQTNRETEEKQRQLDKKNTELENMSKLMETLRKESREMKILLEEQKTKLILQEKELQQQETAVGETSASTAPVRRRNSMENLIPLMSEETSNPKSPVLVPGSELRLVLLGRTGSGKSSAGNIILGREDRSQTGTSTETQQSESRQGEVAGRQVTVVDTPDWFCSRLSLEEVRQDVGLCVRLSAPGPHAFLLVIPVKQSTGEEREMLDKMEEIFGERCWRNTMIIFTVTNEEQEKNIEEFVQSGNQEVQRFVEKCGNRFHCLNINQSGDGSQVLELLEKIEKMEAENTDKFYSSEIYLETETQIREMERKIMREREEKKEREEREMKEKIEKEVQNALRRTEGVIQEHEKDIKQLNERTDKLERQMKEERDEEKKKELERELEEEMHQRSELEKEINRLKEKRERERSEMEERHRQEMEEIREMYEGDVRMETERNLMKIILPELQRNILISKLKMQEEFSRQMEEKNREIETLKQRLSEVTETHSLLKGAYQTTVTSVVDEEKRRSAASGEERKSEGLLKWIFKRKESGDILDV